ncbi:MAG: class I SAM-dependent methyltransferase [Aggregatilineaceae bacterium]
MNQSPLPAPIAAPCPVCGAHWAVPFFDGRSALLAALGWPASAEQARSMPCHPLDFVRCVGCGHVWNRSFCYEHIPYSEQPHRMFNAGTLWQGVLAELAQATLARLPEYPTVIEIGCGNGHFLAALAARRPGRYLGLDPHGSAVQGAGFAFEARLFKPLADLRQYAPDLIVMRHVLEHFTQPAAFLEELAWAAAALDKPVLLLAETPCIDRVFTTGRLADFFYEHPQQFSTSSFRRLLARAGTILDIEHRYDGEVIVGWVRLGLAADCYARAAESARFAANSQQARARIRAQLAELAQSGQRVAIWGGTGKAAAFMHHFGVDAKRFPLVVDSDADKVGTYVPGTGQRIQHRDVLKTEPAQVILIPTQWRAHDILAEMQREGITAQQILIEHAGRLVDLLTDDHPYRRAC